MDGISLVCGKDVLQRHHVGSLRAFRTLLNREFHLLAFHELTETVALDRRIVDEHVWATVAGKETVALLRIEPLDRSDDTFGHCFASFWQPNKKIMMM